jgi:hypothetical protein
MGVPHNSDYAGHKAKQIGSPAYASSRAIHVGYISVDTTPNTRLKVRWVSRPMACLATPLECEMRRCTVLRVRKPWLAEGVQVPGCPAYLVHASSCDYPSVCYEGS